MPDIALIAHAVYLAGGIACLVMVSRSPLPAALFWGTGAVLYLAVAAAEFASAMGWSAFAGLEGDLRYLASSLGLVGLALGAVFSLIVPPGSKRMTLFTGIGLAILIAVAADRLPIGMLPLPMIVLGILLLAALIGLRYRPVPGRWLLLATLAMALAELARYRYLGFLPVPPAALAKIFLGFALTGFGITAFRAR
ncbi:MAG: hypothetical protein ACK4FJ_12115 [Ferrovibrio sp.]